MQNANATAHVEGVNGRRSERPSTVHQKPNLLDQLREVLRSYEMDVI